MNLQNHIYLDITLKENFVNINEILQEVKKVSEKINTILGRKIVEKYSEYIVDKICKEGKLLSFAEHNKKGTNEKCESKEFVLHGTRKKERTLKTELGKTTFKARQIMCKQCGKVFSPVINALKIKRDKQITNGVIKLVCEVVGEESYQRSRNRIEDFANINVPKSTAHMLIMKEEVVEEGKIKEEIDALIPDGTKFNSLEEKEGKGNIRITIGLNKEGKVLPLGVWANTSWYKIGKELIEKFKDKPQPKILTSDGERGIECSESLTEFHQRCLFHEKKDLDFGLWKDNVSLTERKELIEKLNSLIFIDLPKEEYQNISDDVKLKIVDRLERCKEEFRKLINIFEESGYRHAVKYLKNSFDKVYSYVNIWLKTGYICPRTTSILERLFGEIKRRIKGIRARWSDKGIEKVVKIYLEKTFDKAEWNSYWRQKMGIGDGCHIKIADFKIEFVQSI